MRVSPHARARVYVCVASDTNYVYKSENTSLYRLKLLLLLLLFFGDDVDRQISNMLCACVPRARSSLHTYTQPFSFSSL